MCDARGFDWLTVRISVVLVQGKDLVAGGRNKEAVKKETKSENPYVRMLIKIYRFLARRANSPFNEKVGVCQCRCVVVFVL